MATAGSFCLFRSGTLSGLPTVTSASAAAATGAEIAAAMTTASTDHSPRRSTASPPSRSKSTRRSGLLVAPLPRGPTVSPHKNKDECPGEQPFWNACGTQRRQPLVNASKARIRKAAQTATNGDRRDARQTMAWNCHAGGSRVRVRRSVKIPAKWHIALSGRTTNGSGNFRCSGPRLFFCRPRVASPTARAERLPRRRTAGRSRPRRCPRSRACRRPRRATSRRTARRRHGRRPRCRRTRPSRSSPSGNR
jgi:hypothetical protein